MKFQVIFIIFILVAIGGCHSGAGKQSGPELKKNTINWSDDEKVDTLSWAYQAGMQADSIKKGLRKTYYRDTLNRIIPDSTAIAMIATGDYEVWPSLMDLKLWPRPAAKLNARKSINKQPLE